MDEKETIQIRDLRQQGWVWASKVILFDPDIDGSTYKTYAGLSAYASNETQTAYPSITTLARKLSLSRNTVLKGIDKLKNRNYIEVEKCVGASNTYTLLDVYTGETSRNKPKKAKTTEDEETLPTEKTPKQNARDFFVGVADLLEKRTTDESHAVAAFLALVSARYPDAPKNIMWNEIKAFERYWTEKNGTGTKERWQMEKTFEVDRRLATWFAKKKEFANKVQVTGQAKRIV